MRQMRLPSCSSGSITSANASAPWATKPASKMGCAKASSSALRLNTVSKPSRCASSSTPVPAGSYSWREMSPTVLPTLKPACVAAESSRKYGRCTSSQRRLEHCRKAISLDFERLRIGTPWIDNGIILIAHMSICVVPELSHVKILLWHLKQPAFVEEALAAIAHHKIHDTSRLKPLPRQFVVLMNNLELPHAAKIILPRPLKTKTPPQLIRESRHGDTT